MSFWTFKPVAQATDEIDLLVYGYIAETSVWDDEVGAREFRRALDDHKEARRINVRINSGGGDAFAGIAIHSMLKAHPAEVVAHVEGLAGSAASLIAMAGDRVEMAVGSMMMVHNPAALAMGEAADLRRTADVLDKLRDSLVSIYQAKTGKSVEDLQALLDSETWFTAEEAVAQGFADEVAGQPVVPQARGEAVFLNSVSFPRSAVPEALRPVAAPSPAPSLPPPSPALTRELLAVQAPDLLAALVDEGVRAERARQQAIDEVAIPGHEALVSRARYVDPIAAQELAVQILRAERSARADYLAGARADADGATVPAAPLPVPVGIEHEKKKDEELAAAIAAGGTQRRVRR